MTDRLCETCGGPLPPPKIPAPPRRFCSDRCRKAQYAGVCVDCGAATNGSNGRGPNAPERCAKCSDIRRGQFGATQERERWRPRHEWIVELWGQGASLREIADYLGTTVDSLGTTMFRMRAAGWDLPYRYPKERRIRSTTKEAT